jgi:hypothetical protein
VIASDQLSFRGNIAVSTHLDRKGEPVEGPIAIRGDEAIVVELS